MIKHAGGQSPWTIGQLVAATKESASPNGVRVEIPRFQRSLVWGKEQKTDLIDSIHRGFPIGSLLLFRRSNQSGSGDLFQVVDGLQRTSTLIEYAENPLEFAPVSLFPDSAVNAIASLAMVSEDRVRKVVGEWMIDTKNLKHASGFAPSKLIKRLREDLELADQSFDDSLEAVAAEALDALAAEVNISGVTVPVVTYAGDESDLPQIFERINQQGTKLNKYEVFAATWLNSETTVATESIRVAVNDKYNSLLTQGFAISGLEQDKNIQDFNLFEYLFGFGKILVKDHPLLFPNPTEADPTATEPAAFSLACVVRGRPLGAMKTLPSIMPRAADGVIDPASMEAALLEASDAVQSWLRPFTGLKLNSQTNAVDLAHGELQIVSMIARAVVGKWDCAEPGDWSIRPNWEDDWDALRVAMPQHYLMDLLQETWRGPIYSTTFARVWHTTDDKVPVVTGPAAHYAKEIDAATWEAALDTWFEKQLAREQRTRSHVRNVERVLLRFVYTGLVSHLDDAAETFELEHLFPVSRLKDEVAKAGPDEGWPISCIANLALFTKAMNREKLAQTISEYLVAAESGISDVERERLDKYLLCEAGDVSIPESGLTKAEYVEFLRQRWVDMKGQLLKNLKVAVSQAGGQQKGLKP